MDESFLGAVRAAVEPYRHLIAGDLLAGFLCCKGVPGPAEQAGGAICSGEDGAALAKAAVALGYGEGSFAAVDVAGLPPDDLRIIIEAIDPAVVVSVDAPAREVVSQALGTSLPVYGVLVRAAGRRFLAVDSFEESLVSDEAKRRSWHQLKAARRKPID
ncbi:MAG: hypothetical protein Q4A93_03795 [Actinomycetota bacterium]|nr:hypothetical protein [Actinomycetota bacterium]